MGKGAGVSDEHTTAVIYGRPIGQSGQWDLLKGIVDVEWHQHFHDTGYGRRYRKKTTSLRKGYTYWTCELSLDWRAFRTPTTVPCPSLAEMAAETLVANTPKEELLRMKGGAIPEMVFERTVGRILSGELLPLPEPCEDESPRPRSGGGGRTTGR